MIEVRELTKHFYDVVAIDGITFEVGRDEVVGFLGPNGAGKSTTLKILTCFMPATFGSARVAGHDVFSESLAVRRRIGYLPENVPLYRDMRVNEYLQFRARLKGLGGRETNRRLGEILDICGLSDMARRMVGQLSKGYRQRVGLADALLTDPPILLLDEPTGGLDPTQRKEVRDLVSRLGEAHTVFLSSHILAEVESMCSRVIIIKKGRIIADGRPEELANTLQGGERLRIEAAGPLSVLLDSVESFGLKDRVLGSGESEGTCFADLPLLEEKERRVELLRHLVEKGVAVAEFRGERFSLEEIFIRLTLGDEEEVK